MQRLVALTQGLLLGWGRVAVGEGCSLVADWLNACWGTWGSAWELAGQCPQEADMIGGRGVGPLGNGSGWTLETRDELLKITLWGGIGGIVVKESKNSQDGE